MNVRPSRMTMTKRAETVFTQRRKVEDKRRKEKLIVTWRPSLRVCGKFLLRGLLLFTGCTNHVTPVSNTNTPVISQPPTGTTYPMPPTGRAASLANMGWQSDGKRSVFSEYRGKVLVLDFYATWCAPCRDSVPHLIGMQKKYEGQGLVVVGLNVGGPGDDQRVPDFAKEFGIQYTLAQPDEDLVTFLLGDNDGIPQTFVFDRQGQLVQRFTGFGPGTGEYLDEAVETGLKIPAQ